jgi:multidrug resistance efflux pump
MKTATFKLSTVPAGSALLPLAAKGRSVESNVAPDDETHDVAAAALALLAKVLGASTLEAAAHHLVANLAHDFQLDAASIGLHEDGRTRLLASTRAGAVDAQDESTQRLIAAMDEAIEQGVSLAWPHGMSSSGTASSGTATSITASATMPLEPIRLAHEALHRKVGGPIATVPLGLNGDTFGALCVERRSGLPISADECLRIEHLMALSVPALRWMQHGTQSWRKRAWRDVRRAYAALLRPQRRNTRRVLAAAALLFVFLAAVPLEREVSGRARVEGAEQRVLAAPTDGFVKTAHVRPGDRVKAGDALVDLLDGDLRLDLERWGSQLAQHENAYAAAMAKSDRAAASTSLSRISEAQAQLALVDDQLSRGRVVAPFDALVIQGDLSQSIGAPVRQGDTLLTLATTGDYRVIVEVDEVDIARVHAGEPGRLSLSSLPWKSQDIAVTRIAPIAKAVEGRNVFEVEARLLQGGPDLRPGLLGRAQLVVGRAPPLWAWTDHLLDRLRVAWWSWLG